MDNFIFYMWIADVVSGVKAFLLIISIIMGVGGIVVFCSAFSDPDDFKVVKRPVGVSLSIATLLLLIVTILPSSRTVQLLAVAKLGESAMQSPIAEKIINTANVLLDEVVKKAEKHEE